MFLNLTSKLHLFPTRLLPITYICLHYIPLHLALIGGDMPLAIPARAGAQYEMRQKAFIVRQSRFEDGGQERTRVLPIPQATLCVCLSEYHRAGNAPSMPDGLQCAPAKAVLT